MASNARDDPQQRILDSIRLFKDEHDYPPTIAELCQIVGLRSKSTVASHLNRLRDLRLVTWKPHEERTLVVTDEGWIASEVVKAYLDDSGSRLQRRTKRRRLMRQVVRIPEVRAAIEELVASRGVALKDAVEIMCAQIKGTSQEVRLCNDRLVVIQSSAKEQLAALHDYFRMTGMLACPRCGY